MSDPDKFSRAEDAQRELGAGKTPAASSRLMASRPPDHWSFRTAILVLRRVDRLSYWVVAATMLAMATILSAQVIARYGMNASIYSANELARLFFVWAIFLAIPHGIKSGVHVGIDVVVKMLPPTVQQLIFRGVAALGLVLFVWLIPLSWSVVLSKWQELMPTLAVSSALFYIPVLICSVHSTLHLVVLVWGGSGTWQGDSL